MRDGIKSALGSSLRTAGEIGVGVEFLIARPTRKNSPTPRFRNCENEKMSVIQGQVLTLHFALLERARCALRDTPTSMKDTKDPPGRVEGQALIS